MGCVKLEIQGCLLLHHLRNTLEPTGAKVELDPLVEFPRQNGGRGQGKAGCRVQQKSGPWGRMFCVPQLNIYQLNSYFLGATAAGAGLLMSRGSDPR